MTKKQFLEKAKKEGLEIRKNNTKKAKPLEEVCGTLTNKYPTTPEELLDR